MDSRIQIQIPKVWSIGAGFGVFANLFFFCNLIRFHYL